MTAATKRKLDYPPLRCDVCGQFISLDDMTEGFAYRRLVYPDSHFTTEQYETLCSRHMERM